MNRLCLLEDVHDVDICSRVCSMLMERPYLISLWVIVSLRPADWIIPKRRPVPPWLPPRCEVTGSWTGQLCRSRACWENSPGWNPDECGNGGGEVVPFREQLETWSGAGSQRGRTHDTNRAPLRNPKVLPAHLDLRKPRRTDLSHLP